MIGLLVKLYLLGVKEDDIRINGGILNSIKLAFKPEFVERFVNVLILVIVKKGKILTGTGVLRPKGLSQRQRK